MAASNLGSASDNDAGSPETLRLASLPGRLDILERITSEAIREDAINRYRARAQFTFFCGATPAEMVGYEGQLEMVGRCLEWFVFDYLIPELNATPAEYWLAKHANDLSSDDYADAHQCLNYALGLYEVEKVIKGKSFNCSDLFRPHTTYKINETLITNEIQPGQLLLGRLFPNRGCYRLSGMADLMTNHDTEQIKALVHQGKLIPQEITDNLDGIELENLFGRSTGHIAESDNPQYLSDLLDRYLEALDQPNGSRDKIVNKIQKTQQPINVAAEMCEHFQVQCRHEIDLLFAIVSGIWNQSHHLT
ncbi:MAG: hypothetical protein JXD22_12590 [Sedimentisphaerales bacterium]|nr:hypothetical protein [Sedimentisphaerales bacterium]